MNIRKSPSNFIRRLSIGKTWIFTICCCTSRRLSRSPPCSTTTRRPREPFSVPRNTPPTPASPCAGVAILHRVSPACASAPARRPAVSRTTVSASSREWPVRRPASVSPAATGKNCSRRGAQETAGAATVRRADARRTTANATSTGNAAAGPASAPTAQTWISPKIVLSLEKTVGPTSAANTTATND